MKNKKKSDHKLNNKLINNKLTCFFLILILVLAFGLRFYGINWDQFHHFHPDERMIAMVAEKIRLPKPLTLSAILTPKSPLNPKFFAYGSFPIYLLKFTGNIASIFDAKYATYKYLNLVGRYLSVLFDLGTIIVIYKIAKLLNQSLRRIRHAELNSASKSQSEFKTEIPKQVRDDKKHIALTTLLPSLFYTLSVLAIQTSHFYVVDIPLTFFITLTLYQLLKLKTRPSLKSAIATGIAFGLAMATKISAILLIIPVSITLVIIFLRKRNLLSVFCYLFFVICFCSLFFALTMPYALIDFPTFKANTLEQSRMTKDAFIFPYTLQYVGTVPYLYQLKNMVLWGMGIPLGIIAVAGAIFVSLSVLKILFSSVIPAKAGIYKNNLLYRFRVKPGMTRKNKSFKNWKIGKFDNLLILLSFFFPYLLVTGSFAIKFMRYWLPIYPLFCIFGGILMSRIIDFFRSQRTKNKEQRTKTQHKGQILTKFYLLSVICFLLSMFLWPLAFISIYSQPNTRVSATEWINENIPQGSSLAVEHWDDRVPMRGNYQFLEMPMYEPDTSEQKWEIVNSNLEKADYIIIASNRLYTPLMKLTDCQNLPPHRCYPKTAEYYQKLFNASLGFTKVAEFSSFPQLSIFPDSSNRGSSTPTLCVECRDNYQLSINDSSADESFTVYDHPKIMIFKKTGNILMLQ